MPKTKIPYSERKFDKDKKAAYDSKYTKEHFDQVRVLLPKGEKDKLKEYADSQGLTLSDWLRKVIYENWK